eukprot:6184951-Pleurochrysis_carterae.AAC.3
MPRASLTSPPPPASKPTRTISSATAGASQSSFRRANARPMHAVLSSPHAPRSMLDVPEA